MFTGIVEELGQVVGRDDLPDGARLLVRGPTVCSDARPGDSIAVNGVCLTVVATAGDGTFGTEVMGETLRRSTLGSLRPGEPVNLERAARLGDRLGGHLVQGHVDGVGAVRSRTASESGNWDLLRIGLPAGLARYVVEKGSVAVDGVSLTVITVGADEFSFGLIPTTRRLTTLGLRRPGDRVNLEVDVLAKYVERLTSAHLAPSTGWAEG